MPPGAPRAGPGEAKTIDFTLVFDRFREQVLFRGKSDPKKRDGNAAKARRRAPERPKNEDLADTPFSSNWDPQNLQFY
jgi:hypothetical protein